MHCKLGRKRKAGRPKLRICKSSSTKSLKASGSKKQLCRRRKRPSRKPSKKSSKKLVKRRVRRPSIKRRSSKKKVSLRRKKSSKKKVSKKRVSKKKSSKKTCSLKKKSSKKTCGRRRRKQIRVLTDAQIATKHKVLIKKIASMTAKLEKVKTKNESNKIKKELRKTSKGRKRYAPLNLQFESAPIAPPQKRKSLFGKKVRRPMPLLPTAPAQVQAQEQRSVFPSLEY